MRAGWIEWICNLTMLMATLFLILGVVRIISRDFFFRYGKARVIGVETGPGVPGMSIQLEFQPPSGIPPVRASWNPIMAPNGGASKIGEEVNVEYREGAVEDFKAPRLRAELRNSRNLFLTSALLLFFAMAVRYLRAGDF